MRAQFHQLLSQRAASDGEAPAVTYRDDTVTYAQLWGQACAVADLLRALGVGRGDRVAVYLEKRVETVAALFGASAAGAMFVPVNHVLKARQVGHILRDSGARVLVTSADRLAQLSAVLADTVVSQVIVVDGRADVVGGPIAVHDWPSAPGPDGGPTAPSAMAGATARGIDLDPAAILYTSGSTGLPKGVVLSHRNLIVGAESVAEYLRNTSDDVILSVLPLSFDAGLSQVTTAFAVGAHCVLMNYLLPRDVVKLCARHGVTGLTCVPPLWQQLAHVEWPEETARRLRYWANTGGRMPRPLLDRLRSTFTSADPYLMYGLTEAFRSTYLDPAEVDRRPASIGKAIPNAEILVLRPDGTPCRPGEPGELVHRGALVALGYWNDPTRTAERFRPLVHPGQPWRAPETAVWSGDTVVRDEDGFLSFVGRADDMIKTSGYRVSPTEVEEAAYATGLVRDVVALGVADETLGQRIVLVVTAAGDGLEPAAVIAALRSLLPAYMLPARVDIRPDLPRSPNGKFDRPLITAEVSA
ncbi:acyl-CoA ligase (AMP-forming), exosortase A system-associated [Microbacterium sp. W1N]|uniref:acyl-CoA ligase (AMP-forming), exosortase A system-associated n=1 Tax=Microbacterium festucae TaxID=2977531 RepID=UPI0021C043A2|nr:acyl-CoA ligase (AMP-forming), exosortase A system-associated [Microbacterium festucae]MCT9818997.1 acyl-CoA ligase (AMP-forming), exosortase A system-associated [Microbacterium festucae]